MFTEKDLIAGETVLVSKYIPTNKKLYLGSAGLVHFVSNTNDFECANNNNFRIQELNEFYTIEQQKSKVVPLEKKVYNFVPVRVRDKEYNEWKNAFLIAVTPLTDFPFKTVNKNGQSAAYRYCEFLNEQPFHKSNFAVAKDGLKCTQDGIRHYRADGLVMLSHDSDSECLDVIKPSQHITDGMVEYDIYADDSECVEDLTDGWVKDWVIGCAVFVCAMLAVVIFKIIK